MNFHRKLEGEATSPSIEARDVLLAAFTEYQSSDADEMEASIPRNAEGISGFAVASDRKKFLFRANAARFRDVTLVWTGCTTAINVDFPPVSYARRLFQIRNTSRVTIGRQVTNCHFTGAANLVPNHMPWRMDNEAGFENLSLRIEHDALKRKLQTMTGLERTDDLTFLQPSENDSTSLQLLRGATFQLAHEIDKMGAQLSPLATTELEQGLIVRFLLYSRHNHSGLLEQPPLQPGIAQLRRTEDYIAANWDKPLDIDLLAAISGVSARTLFRNFHKLRGCSPHMFVTRVRLQRARDMLLGGHSDVLVSEIATQCGFHAVGHFARAYRDLFGELPSETLRQGRSPVSVKRMAGSRIPAG